MKMALIVSSQYIENYAFNDDGSADAVNPYWKCKGDHTEVVKVLDHTEVLELGTAKLEEMALATVPESDDYAQFTNSDWYLEEITDERIREVKQIVDRNVNDPMQLGYEKWEFGDALWSVVVKELPTSYQNVKAY